MLNRKKRPYYRVSMKQHSKVLVKLTIAFVIVLLAMGIFLKVQPYTHDAKIRTELESKSHQLIETKHKLEQTQTQSQQQKVEQQKQIDELNKQLEETKKELEAKRESARVYAAELPKPVGHVSCGEGVYKQYIYQHESGCSTSSTNASSGACGLGQALPCSKMGCGLSDWACQDRFFDTYAIQRYGSWEKAYYFWLQNHWW